MPETQVKSYVRNGRVIRGYRRRTNGGGPVDNAIRRASEAASWSKADVPGVSWRDQLQTFTWDASGGESTVPAALILRLDPKVFTAAQRRRLEAVLRRIARYEGEGETRSLANRREVIAAVNREAAKMVREGNKGGVIRPKGRPRRTG